MSKRLGHSITNPVYHSGYRGGARANPGPNREISRQDKDLASIRDLNRDDRASMPTPRNSDTNTAATLESLQDSLDHLHLKIDDITYQLNSETGRILGKLDYYLQRDMPGSSQTSFTPSAPSSSEPPGYQASSLTTYTVKRPM